jgi:hypothetical protein
MHFTDANGNKQSVEPVLTQKTFELNDNLHHYSHAGFDNPNPKYDQGFVITDHTISNDTDSHVYIVKRRSNNDSLPIEHLDSIEPNEPTSDSSRMIVPGIKIILEIRQGQDLIESIDCGFVENMEIKSSPCMLLVPENDYGICGISFSFYEIIDKLPHTCTYRVPKSFDNVKYISIDRIELSSNFDKSIYETIVEEITWYYDLK